MSTNDLIGVVGLGRMGSGIAKTLSLAGRTVLGVDPMRRHDTPGVTQVDLPEAFRRCPVLVLSLPGSEQVERVLTGDQGLLALDVAPRLIVDTSTSDPQSTQRLAAQVGAAGHVLVDAPVSGGPSGARAGALTVFLGCPEDHLDQVYEVLAPMADQVTHVGDVGAGNIAKLANNVLCGIQLAAARETWAMARSGGVDPRRLVTAINSASGRSAVTEVNLPRWVLNGSYDSGFPVRLMARDVALAEKVCRQLGVDAPMTGAAVARWKKLEAEVGSETDFNRMVEP